MIKNLLELDPAEVVSIMDSQGVFISKSRVIGFNYAEGHKKHQRMTKTEFETFYYGLKDYLFTFIPGKDERINIKGLGKKRFN